MKEVRQAITLLEGKASQLMQVVRALRMLDQFNNQDGITSPQRKRRKRKPHRISPAGRRAISRAAKARWARVKKMAQKGKKLT